MLDFISNNYITILKVILTVNAFTFAYMYLLARTEFIKWNDNINKVILVILTLLSGFVAIAVCNRMYNYRTKEKFFKLVLPIIFTVEILLIAFFVGREYLPGKIDIEQ
jgi:uncharacterized membrane protein YsdA (DUF1294 family)